MEGRLELHFLPPYAPDLNPDEFVWGHMKSNGVSKKPLRTNESLRKRAEEHLRQIKGDRRTTPCLFVAGLRIEVKSASRGRGRARRGGALPDLAAFGLAERDFGVTIGGRDAFDKFAQTIPFATLRLEQDAIAIQLQIDRVARRDFEF